MNRLLVVLIVLVVAASLTTGIVFAVKKKDDHQHIPINLLHCGNNCSKSSDCPPDCPCTNGVCTKPQAYKQVCWNVPWVGKICKPVKE